MPVRTRSSSSRPAWLSSLSSMAGTAAEAAVAAGLGGSGSGSRYSDDSPNSFRRRSHHFSPHSSSSAFDDELNEADGASPRHRSDRTRRVDPTVTPAASQPYPTTRPVSLLSSDAVFRNVAFVSVVFALGLMFFNVALYIGVMMVSILIPAWRTFKQLERPIQHDIVEDVDEHITVIGEDDRTLRNWHKYWILTAFLVSFHTLIMRPFLASFIPTTLYNAGTMCIFSWLNSNRAANAAIIYDTIVKPTLARSEHTIDVCVESVLAQLDSFTRHIILGINQAVEPYARQLEHAANASRRQMEEQDRRNHVADTYFD